MNDRIIQLLGRYRALGAASYVALLVVLGVLAWHAAADLYTRVQAVSAAGELLAQLESRRPAGQRPGVADNAPQGSPFLEGQSVTVAGAGLLQRVADSVTRASGNVLSTQVDIHDAQSGAGLVSLTVSCELAQADLQKLLYDLEAGMPYLFIDQLTVQAPDSVVRGEGGRLHVLMAVSGQWQGAK